MSPDLDKELIAEIESFRAELRERAEEHARRLAETSWLDLPTIDVSRLELPQIKALIAKRYDDARTQKRLAEVERRVAVLEAERG